MAIASATSTMKFRFEGAPIMRLLLWVVFTIAVLAMIANAPAINICAPPFNLCGAPK